MSEHTCDVCGNPAKVLMWDYEDEARDIWYCFACADGYDDDQIDDSDYCPECDNLGGNRYNDRATPCPVCFRT